MSDFNPYIFWPTVVAQGLTAGALCFAVFRGFAVLKEWRIQKLGEKRADIAGKALLAAMRYIDVIAVMARGVELTSSEDKRTPAERFNDRWAIFGTLDNDFNEAIYQARIYLGDKEADALDAIWKRKTRLWANQLTHLQSDSFYEHAYGDKAAPDLGELLKNVSESLQPWVRLEQPKPKK